jgi:spore maturation protein CgeB|tara:strand:- start:395 stop:1255 length:861 start_codon:yes stop_codon:yes gene_type:complete
MKIMYAAVFTETSTNTPQAKAFEKLGHEVIRYDFKEKLKEFGEGNLRDENIINTCVSEKPDLLLFSKGIGIDISVIITCQDICPVVLWYMDPMVNVDEELLEKIDKVNFVFYTAPTVFNKLKEKNKNSYLIHEGYEPTIHKFYDKIDKVYNVSFIGALKEHRSQYHQSYNFNCFSDKYNRDHCKVINQTRINLNFTNNREGTSDRAYKIMGSGGFLLTEYWNDLEKDFKPDHDLVIFTNESEFKEKIEEYLENWQKRKHIARNGLSTVQKYTVEEWAKFIIKQVTL